MEPTGLWAFCALSLTVALTPGASWLYIITARARDGANGAAAAIAGNATGILGHTLMTATGLAAALRYSAPVFIGIKLLGALYLAWLAVETIRSRPRKVATADQNPNPRSLTDIWRAGMLMNLLNPKAAMLLLAALPQFVVAGSTQATSTFFLLGGIHALTASAVLTGVAIVSARAGRYLSPSAGLEQTFRWLAGAILMGFAVALLLMTPD